MKKLLLLIAACAAVVAVSCTPQDQGTGKTSFSVTPLSLEFEASGNPSQTITVTAENVKWDFSVPAESKTWITVTKTDDKTLTVTVSDNDTALPRNGSILVESDNANFDGKRVAVIQAAGEEATYTMTVEPAAMTFAAEGAQPQEATVTVSSPELSWTVAAEDAIKDWAHVSASGDKITVTVDDNPDTAERIGMVIVTPGNESVKPKAIRITQEGKVLPPSLEVQTTELIFKARPQFGETVLVNAVNVNWDVQISETPDEVSGSVSWIKQPKLFKETEKPNFLVSVEMNPTTEPRIGYLIVTSDVADIPSITIKVTQEAGQEYVTNLTGDVEITDMETGVNNYVFFSPNQEWFDKNFATWDIDLWAAGVERRHDYMGYNHYSGNGTRLRLEIFSSRIVHNWDEEYDLPEGDYEIKAAALDEEQNPIYVPFTIDPGRYTAKEDMLLVPGSWYLETNGGEGVENVYAGKAPLTSGKINVSRNGEDYIFTFDAQDDAGNRITGRCVTKLDNMRVNFFEENEPTPDPNPEEPNPEEPSDPDKPTPFRR